MQQAQKKQDTTKSKQTIPMGMRIANAMHKLGIVGLPRNYEIFYGAMSGTNPELQKALFEAGTGINQQVLDELYGTYCVRADDESVVSRICQHIESKLNDTISLVKQEQSSVQNYGQILNQATEKLNPNVRLPPDVVSRLVGLLSNATEATKNQGRRTLDKMENNSKELATMKSELAEYKKLAETDPLTGLFNRRAFDNMLGNLDKKSLRKSALIVGDIDKFKALNDTYGHPYGDTVLRTVAKTLNANAREDVMIARVGGEEFAIFSHDIDRDGIKTLAERLRVKIAETTFGDGRTRLSAGKVTISFGICHASNVSSAQELYEKADEALYSAKRTGRNQVTSYHDLAIAPDRKKLLLYNH